MPASAPMTSERDYFPGGKAKCLVIFLPGVRDTASDFQANGFIGALRSRGFSVDVISAEATLSYYTQGLLVQRLEADVIGPARARGYQQTWIIGMSMGGMGTLLYSHAHANEVTGVLALAPYLGSRAIHRQIINEGGLASWSAPDRITKVTLMSDRAYQRELWRWLQAITSGREKGPTLYVGWGSEDPWLERPSALLGAALPSGHAYTVPGGHNWKTWSKVLDQFLTDSDFARGCY
jgi:S-formylglutathione hydrolase FrmB